MRSRLDAFYGDFQALFGLDIDVETGEMVAIIGANGAGKITLLACLIGLQRDKRGSIRFDGATIVGRQANRIRAAASPWCPRGGGCSPR